MRIKLKKNKFKVTYAYRIVKEMELANPSLEIWAENGFLKKCMKSRTNLDQLISEPITRTHQVLGELGLIAQRYDWMGTYEFKLQTL